MATSKYCCSECEKGNPCDISFRITSQSSCETLRSVPNLPLSPTSGLYINASGQLDIDCSILGTLCTWPVTSGVPSVTNYTWTVAPNRITRGGQITINVSGLAPFASITFRVTPTFGPEAFVAAQADSSGNVVNKKIRLDIAGVTYSITPVYPGGVPNIGSYSVDVLECGETVECTCLGSVTLKPVLSSYSVVSGQQVTLQILSTNTNTCRIEDLDMPALVLPPEVSSLGVSIVDAFVNGKSTRTFEYPLQVINTSGSSKTINIVIPSGSATFKCNGVEYAAGGGTVALTVAPATGSYCGLIVSDISFIPLTSPDATSVVFAIQIQNIGTVALTNVTMPQLFLGGSGVSITAGTPTIGFGPIPTLAPGATHDAQVTLTYTALNPLPMNHTITVPAGQIYATCSGSLIATGAASSATIQLTP